MNGTNKAIVGVVFGIALIYAALCFIMTAGQIMETGVVSLFLFLPHGGEMGIDLADYIGPLTDLYGKFLGLITDSLAADAAKIVSLLLVVLGFVLSVAGMFSKPSLDVQGTDNPAEYMWTHRPKAFARCLEAPWGLITGLWQKHKALAVVGIVLLPFYAPWSIMITLFLIIPFALVKGIKSAAMKSAYKKDERQYLENIEYGVCPRCKRNFPVPKVKCKCGLVLDYPVPNEYGIKYHTCNRGHRIDCSSKKRSELTAVCPFCGAEIQTREAKPISIAMVGAVGSGKTAMMLSAVKTIMDAGRARDIIVDPVTPGISKDAISAKDYAAKSAQGELDSECMFVRSRNMTEREIVFNDISGQEFEPREDKVLFEEYFNYSDGIIFAFDPIALKNAGRGYTPMETFESFHSMYTQIRAISPGKVSNVPFAIVATKNDTMNPPLKDSDVRGFLVKNGQSDFVRVVESLFSDVRYFAVSSRGDGCQSAASPVWWIVGKRDSELAKAIDVQ